MRQSYKKLAQTKEKLSNRIASMTQPAPLVRIGIIGCGNVVGAYLSVAERLQIRGEAKVIALCGREAHRRRVLDELRVPSFHTDSDELIQRKDIDLVVIVTPMSSHAPLAKAALRAGKHVLMEKPLAVSLEDARELVELARRSPGHLVCAPFTILSPTFQTIARRIRRGDIGRAVSARARYGWAGPDWTDWFYKPGGGALFDLGVYNITTVTGWLGPVRRVAALSGVAIPERVIQGQPLRVEADDNAHVLLDFGGGCLAAITTGFTLQQYRGPGIELYGTEGTVNLLGDDWDPDGYELWQNSAGCWQCFKETQPDWPWADGLRHLVECIRNGTRPAITPEHAYHVLEVMIRAQEAGHDGQTRTIESTFAPPVFADETPKEAVHLVHDRTREH
jgi:predicted dehydrogenase